MPELDLDAIEARTTVAAAMGERFLTERDIPDGEINRYNLDVEQLAEEDVPALVAEVRSLRAENERLTKALDDAIWQATHGGMDSGL